MAKKKTDETTNTFDLQEAIKECPKPDWYKKAFCKVMDLTKIKSQDDLIKAMKRFGGMN